MVARHNIPRLLVSPAPCKRLRLASRREQTVDSHAVLDLKVLSLSRWKSDDCRRRSGCHPRPLHSPTARRRRRRRTDEAEGTRDGRLKVSTSGAAPASTSSRRSVKRFCGGWTGVENELMKFTVKLFR